VSHLHLLVERDGPAAVVTLNRPERRNALSLEFMRELTGCLGELGEDRAVRAVILAAAGKVFCAGHDLTEMTSRGAEDYQRLYAACEELMRTIQSIPPPVIAQVQGLATAAGCQLVATCDLAIASEEAAFATPGVRIGLFCSTPMVALTRAVSRKRAFEMLMTGEAIDAWTAADWGLVNRVVPAVELEAETRRLAARIAEASPWVTALGKRAFYAQLELSQPEAYRSTRECMVANSLAADAQEGIAAFLEKRAPRWSGQ